MQYFGHEQTAFGQIKHSGNPTLDCIALLKAVYSREEHITEEKTAPQQTIRILPVFITSF